MGQRFHKQKNQRRQCRLANSQTHRRLNPQKLSKSKTSQQSINKKTSLKTSQRRT